MVKKYLLIESIKLIDLMSKRYTS